MIYIEPTSVSSKRQQHMQEAETKELRVNDLVVMVLWSFAICRKRTVRATQIHSLPASNTEATIEDRPESYLFSSPIQQDFHCSDSDHFQEQVQSTSNRPSSPHDGNSHAKYKLSCDGADSINEQI